ncbi:uncharacterized protein LOC130913584 [Corythoichthys intestinalis]|uniref:uncharacterized protein LOC130913584 n=1 Tax=Corythoichthys intestinalis TaxID=161448 RepID=UPI0025A61AAE|nr:uncharacterized protein LOC130913584 [Corythoichthys intestinalis]
MATSSKRSDLPAKRKKADSIDSATSTDDLLLASPPEYTKSLSEGIGSIDKKISIALEILQGEIKELKESLVFTQQEVVYLKSQNDILKGAFESTAGLLESMKKENKIMKESILDLQSRSMRDNLIFSGIEENTDKPEALVKSFMATSLKLPKEMVDSIKFTRVHRLGKPRGSGPCPIIAKFELYQQKVLVKSKGRELQGTRFVVHCVREKMSAHLSSTPLSNHRLWLFAVWTHDGML